MCVNHIFPTLVTMVVAAYFIMSFYRWVQVACPRLSIDWGYAFPKPLLSPYEVNQLCS